MTDRQLKIVQQVMQGLEMAQQNLTGPGADAHVERVIDEEFLRDGYEPMSVGHLTYLACCIIRYKELHANELSD